MRRWLEEIADRTWVVCAKVRSVPTAYAKQEGLLLAGEVCDDGADCQSSACGFRTDSIGQKNTVARWFSVAWWHANPDVRVPHATCHPKCGGMRCTVVFGVTPRRRCSLDDDYGPTVSLLHR